MNSSSTLASSSFSTSSSLFQYKLIPSKPTQPSLLRFDPPHSHNSHNVPALKVTASSAAHHHRPLLPGNTHNNPSPILQTLKHYAKTAILIGVTAAVFTTKSSTLLAIAEPTPTLSDFLGSNSEAIGALKSLLQQKLENGEDDEALKILQRLVEAQPSNTEWKFMMERENERTRESLRFGLCERALR
ncbi:uncharacterized protein LOC125480465 [Pyrus x bretschneideri]|uniref:uncharacterized protein LOC125480465 n=1 Tax=Pyrus x bretschneideri TaxID=225117 RepID=UPI00202EC3B4|nr:uncharacterized protein LOC125480465 [Pyrus x bretschneideri]